MSNDFRHITIAAVIALMLLLAGVFIGRLSKSQTVTNCNQLPPSDTTWFTITETITVPSPPDTVTNTVIKYVQVPKYIHDTDTIHDNITVPLPFEQHEITVEDVAKVWVNGYGVEVDSAVAYRHHTTEIVDHYITIQPPANLVTASAGVQDASLTYMHRLGSRFWLGASAGSTYTGQPTARAVIGWQF